MKSIARDIFMSSGMGMKLVLGAPSAERSARTWPSGCGGSQDRWGDREDRKIRSSENINAKEERG